MMTRRRSRRLRADLGGFREDAVKAIQTTPNYFAAWYTAKSWLLVGVATALAYQLGKNSMRSDK